MTRQWLPVWCVVAALAFVGGFAQAGDTPWGGGGGGGGARIASGSGTENALAKFDVKANTVEDSCISDAAGTVTATCGGGMTLAMTTPGYHVKDTDSLYSANAFTGYFASYDSANTLAWSVGDVSGSNARIDVALYQGSQSFTVSPGNGTAVFSVDYNGNTTHGDSSGDTHAFTGPLTQSSNQAILASGHTSYTAAIGGAAVLVDPGASGTAGTYLFGVRYGGSGEKFSVLREGTARVIATGSTGIVIKGSPDVASDTNEDLTLSGNGTGDVVVADGDYLRVGDNNAGAPAAGDCNGTNGDTNRGRISIDTTNNRLYVCNGITRQWDYVALTD